MKKKVNTKWEETVPQNSTEPKSYFGYCFMKMKNNFYDLNPFNRIDASFIKSAVAGGEKIKFNFCSNVDTKCNPNDALAVSPTQCKRFAGKADQEKEWTLSQNANKQDVITLRLPQGDVCANGKNYQTVYELTCDAKVNYQLDSQSFNPNACQNSIKITSKYGKYNLF
jgi:hypothetical protein